MSWFVGVMAVCLAIDSIGKLTMLGTGRFLPRTAGTTAWDAGINMILLAWALVLLFGDKR